MAYFETNDIKNKMQENNNKLKINEERNVISDNMINNCILHNPIRNIDFNQIYPIRNIDFNQIYPVGSIYLSVNNVDPSILFGGKWTKINNKVLVQANNLYSANTRVELPIHNNISYHNNVAGIHNNVFSGSNWNNEFYGNAFISRTLGNSEYTLDNAKIDLEMQSKNENILLIPYIAVYFWQRIS